MKCPSCGAAELIHDTRDLPYTYKGETTAIVSVTGDFCPVCSDVILDGKQGDRYSELKCGRFEVAICDIKLGWQRIKRLNLQFYPSNIPIAAVFIS